MREPSLGDKFVLPQVLSRAGSGDLDLRQASKLALLQALLARQKAELDCFSVCTLCRSHVTSNGLLKSYCSNGDNKRMAVCLFHDALKSSTDDFAYQLYCRPCEGLYMERSRYNNHQQQVCAG